MTQVAWHFLLAFSDFFIWQQIKDDRAFNMKWLSNTFKSGWPIDRHRTDNSKANLSPRLHELCTLDKSFSLSNMVWNRLGIQRVRTLGILELYCFRFQAFVFILLAEQGPWLARAESQMFLFTEISYAPFYSSFLCVYVSAMPFWLAENPIWAENWGGKKWVMTDRFQVILWKHETWPRKKCAEIKIFAAR